ncbi:MAG TPA: magnesium/cobalt transporter CorA [Candidatus Methylomirabilis sp.]|nr:magnesium/cobalt transporter CorA [Candidatus Methylomirabilis sp.]
MSRVVHKRSRKAGLPPGTPVLIGERKSEATRLTLLHYDEQSATEKEIQVVEECRAFRDTPGVTWINVTGLHEVERLAQLGNTLSLHPLVLEDIFNTDQRPKSEDYGEYIYVVLKALGNGDVEQEITAEQVSLILGRHFVISFLESDSGLFNAVKERVRKNPDRFGKMGADYLAYALMDTVVDNYFAIFEKLGDRIEALQQSLVARPAQETLRSLNTLKREMLFLRKSVWPLREVVSGLQRGDSPLIQKATGLYLRDLYDHIIHVIDTIETYRDMLSGMLDIYLSSLNMRLNEVMKVLTIIATIFMPLSFIVGVYGMNFRYMPELGWHWGYPLVLLLMLAIAGGMLVFFRRRKWI